MTQTYTSIHTLAPVLSESLRMNGGVIHGQAIIPVSGPSRESILEAFLARLDSPHTRRAYHRHILAALDFLAVEIGLVTGALLARYRAHVVEGSSAATASQALAALRTFFLWCRKDHVRLSPLSSDTIEDALEMPSVHVEKPYDVLDDEELARLLAAASSVRDRALLAVMSGCGLRVSEAVALDVEDVKRNGVIHVRQGKGGKDRTVPCPSTVTAALRAVIEDRTSGPLFLSADRAARSREESRMTTRAAALALKRALEAAGVSRRISPHSLRHTYAVRFLRATRNVEGLRNVLGHSSLTVTSRYSAHLAIEELQKTVPELP